jgi:hypothetical protein
MKKLSLLASWNLDQNLGETYEYALKRKINLHRLGSSEGTLTSVCVYEPETIKLNTDHYFIEQYNRQRALQNIYAAVYLPVGILTRTWERHTNMSWKSLTGLTV